MRLVLPLGCALLLLASTAEAQPRSRKAHEHGAATVNIAIEGSTATVELEAPAQGFVGFEHVAHTAAEKQKQAAALQMIRTRFAEMVMLPPEANCRYTAKKVEVAAEEHGQHAAPTAARKKSPTHEEEHAEVRAEFTAACQKPLTSGQIRFGVTKLFPAVQELRVQVVSETQQSGVSVRNNQGTITLSR